MTWLTGGLSILKQVVVGGLLLLLLAVYGIAEDHYVAKRLRETGQILPIERILQTLSSVHPVSILDVTLRDWQGYFVYSIEYLDARGIVWEKQYDATRGILLRTRKGK